MENAKQIDSDNPAKTPGAPSIFVRPAPGCRFDPPGHVKFKDGCIIQWGVATATPEGTKVTLAVPLSVELWGVAADKADTGPVTVPLAVTETNRLGFKIYADAAVDVGYIAVGR